jgi:hypothetical protein
MPRPIMAANMATACMKVPSGEATTTSIKGLPAGKTVHQSTATMVYIFCFMVVGLDFGFLVALRNARAVASGEAGFFETGSGAGDVIGNAAVDEQALLEVVEHIAGQGIIITGLADAADIHRVAFLGFEACGFF